MLLVAAAVVFFRWFVRQPKLARADVIQLIRLEATSMTLIGRADAATAAMTRYTAWIAAMKRLLHG